MAGGKETTRQKMINLMYLVLLAMLALQVSSTILQKFMFLDHAISEATNEAFKRNGESVEGIKAKVEERGGKDMEKEVVKQAKELHKRTDNLLGYIEDVRNEMATEGIGAEKEEDGGYATADLKDEEGVMQFMIGSGDSKSGKGYELEDKLNDYVNYINSIKGNLPDSLQKLFELEQKEMLAKSGKEHDQFKDDPDQRNKDFAELNFEHTPFGAALAVLSEYQNKVAKYESDAMGALEGLVGASDFKFDKVVGMYRAKSSRVAAGTKYEAQMFITARSSSAKPEMTLNGKNIPVEDGMGKVEFKVSGGKYGNDGTIDRTWKGEIKINNPTGAGKKTIDVNGEYTVVKPVIDIQSKSVGSLYRNCGNPLTVKVPALGSYYSPNFKADGAQVISGDNKGDIYVVPSARKVTLHVRSDGMYVGNKEFPVKAVPKPDLKILNRGQPVNRRDGEPASSVRSLMVRAVPDPSFKETNPRDARYSIKSVEAILARGSRVLARQNASSGNVNLQSFVSKAKPGDRINIEVKRIIRKNFQNRTEEVKIVNNIVNIPLK